MILLFLVNYSYLSNYTIPFSHTHIRHEKYYKNRPNAPQKMFIPSRTFFLRFRFRLFIYHSMRNFMPSAYRPKGRTRVNRGDLHEALAKTFPKGRRRREVMIRKEVARAGARFVEWTILIDQSGNDRRNHGLSCASTKPTEMLVERFP